ncbi:MAG TPA: hypothetical protein VIL24_03140 [Clostridia bacterium]
MSKLAKVNYKGSQVYVSDLEMLKQDNICLNRLDRVKAIEKKIKDLYANPPKN